MYSILYTGIILHPHTQAHDRVRVLDPQRLVLVDGDHLVRLGVVFGPSGDFEAVSGAVEAHVC